MLQTAICYRFLTKIEELASVFWMYKKNILMSLVLPFTNFTEPIMRGYILIPNNIYTNSELIVSLPFESYDYVLSLDAK